MLAWLAGLEASAFARALAASVWVYPLINAGHLLGVALLVGGIVPVDLRLLGAWRPVPLQAFGRPLIRCAAFGLILAAACGVLLFITRASEYVVSGFFLAKMGVVALGIANALALRLASFNANLRAGDPLPAHIRIAAAISLTVWLTALLLGRLVGYR
jgi:hypothetical protein